MANVINRLLLLSLHLSVDHEHPAAGGSGELGVYGGDSAGQAGQHVAAGVVGPRVISPTRDYDLTVADDTELMIMT